MESSVYETVDYYNNKCKMIGKNPKLKVIDEKIFYNVAQADSKVVEIPDFVYGLYSKNAIESEIIKIISSRITNGVKFNSSALTNSQLLFILELKYLINDKTTEILFNDNVKYIHETTFSNFTSLERVSDMDKVEYYLGTYGLFSNCKNLKEKPRMSQKFKETSSTYIGTRFYNS